MEAKARILGVDDSLTIRKALEIVLKPAGYELELAADGAEALAKAKSFRPALILLDFILPDMRGSEVCQHLALDPETSNIPVILVSAKGAEIRQAYRDARNVVSYIAKPFKPQVVTSIVAEVLAKAAAGELIKSTVPVHEAEGLAAAPTAEPVAPSPQETAAPRQAVSLPPPHIAQLDVSRASAYQDSAPHAPLAAASDGRTADESEESDLEEPAELTSAAPAGLSDHARREALELMFETLRAGIEGVYVEEVDTPLGAAADQAKSYTDLLESMTRELAEGSCHAQSGARYFMYGDGSVRSLDESLLEIFRRSCRLLFRAVSAGSVSNEAAPSRRRILVACQRDSQMHRQVPALLAAHPEWQAFTVCEGFRQLPMMARLYGPTDIIAEVTWGGALWDQLRLIQRLPEAQQIAVVGVTSADRALPAALTDGAAHTAALAERGLAKVVGSVFDLDDQLPTSARSDLAAPSVSDAHAEHAAL